MRIMPLAPFITTLRHETSLRDKTGRTTVHDPLHAGTDLRKTAAAWRTLWPPAPLQGEHRAIRLPAARHASRVPRLTASLRIDARTGWIPLDCSTRPMMSLTL